MTITSLPERFWPKVAEDENGCWVWTAAKSAAGYGQIWSREAQARLYAHRVSYELMVGEIPSGLQLDHLCRNRACVNPYHLDPVPSAENTRRGRMVELLLLRRASQTHCRHGHEFTPANTHRYPSGHRACRECSNARQREYQRRKRAAA